MGTHPNSREGEFKVHSRWQGVPVDGSDFRPKSLHEYPSLACLCRAIDVSVQGASGLEVHRGFFRPRNELDCSPSIKERMSLEDIMDQTTTCLIVLCVWPL